MSAPVMEAHLYVTPEPSAPQTAEAEGEGPDEGSSPPFICAAVNAPPGRRNGNWTMNVKKKKNREGRRDGGTDGQWRRGLNHPGAKER